MLCYYLKRLRMHRKLWQCESRVFPYTHDVIWVFSLSLASLNVVGLLASNFSRESLICSQGPLCISDIIGVSSVILVFASYNVVDLLVSNFSRESPICSWGPLRISDIIGFSSVVFASYDVIWREVRGSHLFSRFNLYICSGLFAVLLAICMEVRDILSLFYRLIL